jgi:hypothetical protein
MLLEHKVSKPHGVRLTYLRNHYRHAEYLWFSNIASRDTAFSICLERFDSRSKKGLLLAVDKVTEEGYVSPKRPKRGRW